MTRLITDAEGHAVAYANEAQINRVRRLGAAEGCTSCLRGIYRNETLLAMAAECDGRATELMNVLKRAGASTRC